jgi:hypothetical protein
VYCVSARALVCAHVRVFVCVCVCLCVSYERRRERHAPLFVSACFSILRLNWDRRYHESSKQDVRNLLQLSYTVYVLLTFRMPQLSS